MIKFIEAEKTVARLTFEDVEDNQFFVDVAGRLCQKVSCITCSTITDNNGFPYAAHRQLPLKAPLQRILDKVERIDF